MTPEICLISVPHNGTVFTIQMFVDNGWEEQPLNGRPRTMPTLYQGHCEKTTQCVAAVMLSRRMPVVMPLRHPYRVEESWKRRGEDLKRMRTAYDHMLNGLYEHVSVWVPVDGDALVRWVAGQELDKVADKRLVIHWDKPANVVHGTSAVPLTDLDPSPEIRDIRMHPVFVEHYGGTDG